MGWRWMGVVACVAMSAAASAAVLCKTSSGLVAVRDTCKGGETQLNPVALGLQGPPGPPGPTGATGTTGPPGPGLVVKDANGNLVGLVMSTDCSGTCAAIVSRRFAEGVVASFQVNPGGVNISSGTVFFESTDCSGTPLVEAADNVVPRLAASDLFVSDTVSATAYYPMYPGSPHNARSMVHFGYQATCVGGVFSPPDRCCLLGGTDSTTAPAGTLDWTPILGLVPPFHVEGP